MSRRLSSKLHDLYQEYNKQWYGWYNPDRIEQFVKNKFITVREADYISNITPFLNEIYPEQWDIQLLPFINVKVASRIRISSGDTEVDKTPRSKSPVFVLHPVIVLHFPQHNVTNGTIVHTIHDLYFYLPFFESQGQIKIIPYFYGVRTSFTQFEVNRNYSFSHLPSNDINDFLSARPKKFCLGSSEMNQIPLLINAYPEEYNYFKLLLLQAKEYVKWESLDGGPYIKLNNIYSEGTSLYSPNQGEIKSCSERVLNKLIEQLMEGEYVLPLVISKNYILLNPDDNFLQRLRMIAEQIEISENLIVSRSAEGQYYSDRTISDREFNTEIARSLIFKGEWKKVNLIPSEENEAEIIKYLHPNIVEDVINRINKQLKERTVKNYISQRLQSTSVH